MTSLLIEEGWSALRQGELAAARRSFEIALAEDESGEVLDGLAVALYLECEYRDAAALFERAYAAYHRSGNHRAAGFAARFVAWIRGNVLGDWAVESGWFARALAMFESAADDSSAHGWALVTRAQSAQEGGTREALLRDAIATGRRLGDTDLEFDALAWLGALYVMTIASIRVSSTSMRHWRAHARAKSVKSRVSTRCSASSSGRASRSTMWRAPTSGCGRANRLWRNATSLPLLSRPLRRHPHRGRTMAGGRGRVARGYASFRPRPLTEAGHCHHPPRRASGTPGKARRGGRAARRPRTASRRGAHDRRPPPRPGPRRAAAHDVLERATAGPDDDTPRVGETTILGPLLALLVEACLADRDHRAAATAAERLHRIADAQRGAYLRAASALARGLVCVASGDDRARSCLHDAMEGFAAAQLPLELATAHLAMARATLPDAPDVAVAEATAALRAFERLDARVSVDATAELLRSLGTPVRKGPRKSGTLTKRESEVLQLVGVGLSNPEIAVRLRISRKTVEHHVSNVLAKLGLRNRAEAAAFAVRERAGGTAKPGGT